MATRIRYFSELPITQKGEKNNFMSQSKNIWNIVEFKFSTQPIRNFLTVCAPFEFVRYFTIGPTQYTRSHCLPLCSLSEKFLFLFWLGFLFNIQLYSSVSDIFILIIVIILTHNINKYTGACTCIYSIDTSLYIHARLLPQIILMFTDMSNS